MLVLACKGEAHVMDSVSAWDLEHAKTNFTWESKIYKL